MKQTPLFLISIVVSVALFATLNFLAPIQMSNMLTGFNGEISDWTNWLNVHLFIWASFFLGMLLIYFHRKENKFQQMVAADPILSRDPNIVYSEKNRADIYVKASQLPEGSYLKQMVQRALMQYQGSKSWSQANEVLQATTGEIQNRIDLGYSTIRYLSWVIPTLGFIGTVLGIASALEFVGQLPPDAFNDTVFISDTVGKLGIAFSTTLVALILSGILILFATTTQAAEDKLVTDIYGDCVDNLLNKLHEEN